VPNLLGLSNVYFGKLLVFKFTDRELLEKTVEKTKTIRIKILNLADDSPIRFKYASNISSALSKSADLSNCRTRALLINRMKPL
jgi:hypothetical protein